MARLHGSVFSGLGFARHSDRACQETRTDLWAVRAERGGAAGAPASDSVERNGSTCSQVCGTGVGRPLCLRRSPHDRGSDAPRRGAVRRFVAHDVSSIGALLCRGEGEGLRGRNDRGGKDSMNPQDRNSHVGAAMVVGGRIGGMQAALDLADAGIKVYLVETTSAIGGRMAQLDKTFPTNDCAMCTMPPRLVEIGRHR